MAKIFSVAKTLILKQHLLRNLVLGSPVGLALPNIVGNLSYSSSFGKSFEKTGNRLKSRAITLHHFAVPGGELDDGVHYSCNSSLRVYGS
jgi:hypothetical protein